MSLSTGAVVGALALDVLVGEPPNSLHPVAWFGRLVGTLDREWHRPRAVGVALALSVPLAAALVAGSLVWLAGTVDRWAAVATGAVVLFVVTSLRALLATVRRVGELATTDLSAARTELAALAGRDATSLDAGGVRSAALESLAENLADGLVAPLTAFTAGTVLATVLGLGSIGTLALACACAVWIKAVNTMDSMVGYPDRPLGFGAAKTDDAAMWVPARLTALALALWFLVPGALGSVPDRAAAVRSPNSGWPMAVLAAGLDVRLEKAGHYVLHPCGSVPTQSAVRRGVRRVGLAALSAYGVAGVIAWY